MYGYEKRKENTFSRFLFCCCCWIWNRDPGSGIWDPGQINQGPGSRISNTATPVFLGQLKGSQLFKLQTTSFSIWDKKVGVCFDGALATKKIILLLVYSMVIIIQRTDMIFTFTKHICEIYTSKSTRQHPIQKVKVSQHKEQS